MGSGSIVSFVKFLLAISLVQNGFGLDDDLNGAVASVRRWRISYDQTDSVPEMIQKEGYPVEVHQVITKDGYILGMHRIPHGVNEVVPSSEKRPVIFLHHGLTSSSADYVVNAPNEALAYMLADAGYDVWMANCRGNQYSRAHQTLNTNGKAFWDFSIDQIATIDLPAEIDFVLNYTASEDLHYVGFSMGTTVFFALMSEQPEYNDKVKLMVALAPVAYTRHIKGLAAIFAPLAGIIHMTLQTLGIHEIASGDDLMDAFVELLCTGSFEMDLCISFIEDVVGPDKKEFLRDIMMTAITATPAAASVNTVYQYAQLANSGKFCKYDYGSSSANRKHYGLSKPPSYDLTKVTAPVAMMSGSADYLATPKDVQHLQNELPNVVYAQQINSPPYNHLDFLWGKHAPRLIYDKVIELLAQHPSQSTKTEPLGRYNFGKMQSFA